MRNQRAKTNSDYARILILSRVIVSLEDEAVTPEMLEALFVSDFKYL